MSRVVPATVVGAGPHRLAAARPDELDPVVRSLIDEARAAAYERGLREGHERGRAERARADDERIERLAAAVGAAVEQGVRAVRAACDEAVGAAFTLAVAMAGAILDHEPHDGGAAVAHRVRATLGQLDEPAPVVRVAPADVDALRAATADLSAVVVEPDPALAPGEARIHGTWAEADLTRAAAFDALRRELGADQ